MHIFNAIERSRPPLLISMLDRAYHLMQADQAQAGFEKGRQESLKNSEPCTTANSLHFQLHNSYPCIMAERMLRRSTLMLGAMTSMS